MRRRTFRRFAWLGLLTGGALFAAASRVASRRLAERLVSPRGLAPPPPNRLSLLAALSDRAALVSEFAHDGSVIDPVELSGVFASPDRPAARPTILFLHGKGGNAAEWEPAAARALEAGYNVLIPDLRGHGASGGEFVTYGLLEREDLGNAVETARGRFGLDPLRIGVHSCSAGSAVALAFAASHPELRALWLESPFGEPGEMARHYLSISTGIPGFLLGLTARWAVRDAIASVERRLGAARKGSLRDVDPVRLASELRMPVQLVYGRTDRLIPPRFVERLAAALPPGSGVWQTPAGHCHHEDEPEKVVADEYRRRWREFFGRYLPVLLR
jgi:pimeloyl-ACP methyl ester carboxylesterase